MVVGHVVPSLVVGVGHVALMELVMAEYRHLLNRHNFHRHQIHRVRPVEEAMQMTSQTEVIHQVSQ